MLLGIRKTFWTRSVDLVKSNRSMSLIPGKIEIAFAAGYDPALDLANSSRDRNQSVPEELEWDLDGPWTQHLRRKEQDLVDSIVHGTEPGHYFVLLGPKACPLFSAACRCTHD